MDATCTIMDAAISTHRANQFQPCLVSYFGLARFNSRTRPGHVQLAGLSIIIRSSSELFIHLGHLPLALRTGIARLHDRKLNSRRLLRRGASITREKVDVFFPHTSLSGRLVVA